MFKKKINIFLQARSDSNRLPYKSLVPINNIPLVVLCAKRLSGKYFQVTVLTSKNKSDDFLVEELKKNKIDYYRGDLNNVFKRFLDCAKKLQEKDIIIRATADNPFVNYSFVRSVLNNFINKKEIYKGVDYKKHNLPYGMSIEIFKKSLLIKYKNQMDSNQKEHVTPKFYKHTNKEIINSIKLIKNYSNLSCTVDTFDDYKKINDIFKKYKNPQKASWQSLIYSLSKYKKDHDKYFSKTKYIIGGAQIGNNYANFDKLKIENIFRKRVVQNSFTVIDTAYNYTDSHKNISNIKVRKKINIITKLNYADVINKRYNYENFFLNFYKILIDLNNLKIDTLLIHSYSDFKKYSPKIIKIFFKLKSLGLINNYGVSIYHPGEIKFLMNNFKNLTIQFPINFIDHRWNKLDLNFLKKKSNSKLIGRSIFLRGKLLKKDGFIDDFKKNQIVQKKIDKIKNIYSIKNNFELCIRYVNSINYLDHIVIGFENYHQIKEFILFQNKKFFRNQIKHINKKFDFLSSKYLDILKL